MNRAKWDSATLVAFPWQRESSTRLARAQAQGSIRSQRVTTRYPGNSFTRA
jgi:hypothetical protein